jgi:hypothetical protein
MENRDEKSRLMIENEDEWKGRWMEEMEGGG